MKRKRSFPLQTWVLAAAVLLAVALIALLMLSDPGELPVVERAAESPAPAPTVESAAEPVEPPAPSIPAVAAPVLARVEGGLECAIAGRVLQPDGRPAAGAEIGHSWGPDPRQPPLETPPGQEPVAGAVRADSDGYFRIEGLLRGDVTLIARHESGRTSERVELSVQRPMREVTLVLAGGPALGGTVVDRAGQGIAGAVVAPVAFDGVAIRTEGIGAGAVTTGPGGAFRLEALRPGQWTLHVSAEGYGPVVSEPLEAGIENARIVLASGVTLPCRVVSESDAAPAAGVTVTRAYRSYRTEPERAETDGEGRVSFPFTGPGDYLLDLDDPAWTLAGPPVAVTVDAARNPEPVTLVAVSAAGRIQGHLLDGVTGQGIADTVIRAWQGERRRGYSSTPTDAAGAYEFVGLPPGTYTVEPPHRLPGYPQDPLEGLDKIVEVSPGEVTAGVDFVLTAGAALAGTVVDAAGEPVSGATVRARSAEGRQNQAEYYTGEDGFFTFGDYAEGEAAHLVAETAAARSGRAGPFVAGAPGSDAIVLRLELDCTGVIAGRVVDRRGAPFPCQIMALAEEDALQFPVLWPTGETDGAGNFVMAEVCAGTYSLVIVPRSNARQTAQTVRVAAGQSVLGLNLVYDQGELFTLGGVVVDGEGNPIAGARVSYHIGSPVGLGPGSSARANGDGEFLFRDLPDGDYMLMGDAEGYTLYRPVSARAGDSDVVVTLIAVPELSGRVTDQAGKPITSYTVMLVTDEDTGRATQRRTVASETGAFSISMASGGALSGAMPVLAPWILRVEAAGYDPVELPLTPPGPGEQPEPVNIVLQAAP